MIETEKDIEKVILVAVEFPGCGDVEASLTELSELTETAGAECLAKLVQKLPAIHPGTYIGSGKIEELSAMIAMHDATGIVCDDELSPVQMRNLEDLLGVKVMDRTMVILDIFASRASTAEGKIQVELAQLKYQAGRLTGRGTAMSRLGGGIGTRGPGEKKLEVDRRLIHERISRLKRDLEAVVKHRSVQRKQRLYHISPVICIVGYTNAGKSTLLNHLTGAKVLAEDKLFATLDPTTRSYQMADGQTVMFTDTVGFIRKLPHHLIQAFQSTLEEAKYADIILHVVDCSNPCMDVQMHTVYETLRQLEIEDKPVITVFNKMDCLEEMPVVRDFHAERTVFVSALKNQGFDELLMAVSRVLMEQKQYIEKMYSYAQAGQVNRLRIMGQVISEEYLPEGILVKAYVPAGMIL